MYPLEPPALLHTLTGSVGLQNPPPRCPQSDCEDPLSGSVLLPAPVTAAVPVPERGAQLMEPGPVGRADGPAGGAGLSPHLRARLLEGRTRSREGKGPKPAPGSCPLPRSMKKPRGIQNSKSRTWPSDERYFI